MGDVPATRAMRFVLGLRRRATSAKAGDVVSHDVAGHKAARRGAFQGLSIAPIDFSGDDGHPGKSESLSLSKKSTA